MPDLDDKIATAKRHVDEGRRILERHRKQFGEGGGPEAERLRKNFEQSQDIFELDLLRLLHERDERKNR